MTDRPQAPALRQGVAVCLWAVVLIGCASGPSPRPGATAGQPTIMLVRPPGDAGAVFAVAPIPPDELARLRDGLAAGRLVWPDVLVVYVDTSRAASGGPPPAIDGSYTFAPDGIRFRPSFPLDHGVRYVAVYHPAPSGRVSPEPQTKRFLTPPLPVGEPTRVTDVYPSADRLPENLLKFYLYFSAPMSRGQAYRHIRLLDGGQPVELPFIEPQQELWDPDQRRLTLLLDPGRIKHGLALDQAVGPPLIAGHHYVLEVDDRWPDARGQALGRTFRKTFTVRPADHDPPKVASWRVYPPEAGTADPLRVVLTEPLDHALLRRSIVVRDASGRVLTGGVSLTHDESVWRFTPASPWSADRYEIVVDPVLEDLAGNTLDRPFDVDLGAGTPGPEGGQRDRRSFEVTE